MRVDAAPFTVEERAPTIMHLRAPFASILISEHIGASELRVQAGALVLSEPSAPPTACCAVGTRKARQMAHLEFMQIQSKTVA